MTQLDSGFYQKLLQLADKVGMKPENILNVMTVESGLNPGADNPNGHASGLVQIMPQFLSGLGFKGTDKEFRETSGSQQLDYVEKIINNLMRVKGGSLTGTQYYIGNFLPVALQLRGVREENPGTIIVSKNPIEAHLPHVGIQQEKSFYNSNSSLDADHDGNITVGDIQTVLSRARGNSAYQHAVKELDRIRGTSSGSIDSINKPIDKQQNINILLDRYLSIVNSQYNNITIKIIANNINNALEFSRLLSLGLDEEFSAKVSTHINNDMIEVECCAVGNQDKLFPAIEQFCDVLAEEFYIATKKIGGIKIATDVITNKKSSYQYINLKMAEVEHRKFLLKFI